MKLLLLSLTVFALSASLAKAECGAVTREDFSSEKHRLVCDDADLGGSDSLKEIQKAVEFRNCQGSVVGDIGCRAGANEAQDEDSK